MSKKNDMESGGIGFFGLLAILFIALKLTGFIDWSWWWVLSPLWGPLCVLVAGVIVFGAIYAVVEFFRKSNSRPQ